MPAPAPLPRVVYRRPPARWPWALLALVPLAAAGIGLLSTRPEGSHASYAAPGSAADERQRQILAASIDAPGDPELGRRFAAMNGAHFNGALPAMPVRWEPRLEEVGAAAGRAFTLQGMFGRVGDRSLILLHPLLKPDPAALDRALAHEMVHAYLFTIGDTGTDHGPAFQAELRRLAEEGAFTGIVSTDEERAGLRAWIDAESARLEDERASMEAERDEMERERAEIEAAIAAFDARVAAAPRPADSMPDEAAAINRRRDQYIDRAARLNARADRYRAAQEELVRQTDRYNLMVVYPHGGADE